MKARIIKTDLGYEPAFSHRDALGNYGEYEIEPGFANPTRREAQAALDADLRADQRVSAADRIYQSGFASACGYHD
jgi:hypothetical protein